MAIMTQDERIAAERRVREALGIAMVGAYPGRRPKETAAVESEILGVQMFALGEIWGRPALGLKERCFITLATLGTKDHPRQLAVYVRAALKLGITPSEVLETFLQMGVYSGLSAACDAMDVARDVFAEEGIGKGDPGVEIEPVFPMTHEDRTAAMSRVGRDLGIGRLGLAADAPPLAMLKGGPWSTAAHDLPLEIEINAIGGEYGYGEVWGRKALGYRIREFITLATLQTLVENDQLHFHLNNAVSLGISAEDIHEVLIHVGVYAGISGWRNAANVLRDVFLQRGIVEPVDAARAAQHQMEVSNIALARAKGLPGSKE